MVLLLVFAAGFVGGALFMGVLSGGGGSAERESDAFKSGYQLGFEEAEKRYGLKPSEEKVKAPAEPVMSRVVPHNAEPVKG